MYGLAAGTKNGGPATVGVSVISLANHGTGTDEIGMGAIIGIPLACGIKFLADGQLKRPGVLPQNMDLSNQKPL